MVVKNKSCVELLIALDSSTLWILEPKYLYLYIANAILFMKFTKTSHTSRRAPTVVISFPSGWCFLGGDVCKSVF